MSSIASIDGNARPAPAAAQGQLAQLEKQRSEWVHCASAKTQAGRDKIAELSSKIDAIKSALQQEAARRASEAQGPAAVVPANAAAPLRLDGVGAWLSVQA